MSEIPLELESWDIPTLDRLTKLRDIERETFDFKGADFDELYKHLCAFANFPVGGIIVLGIEEEKSVSGYLIQFRKKGFDLEKEGWVRNEINNQMANVGPTPKLDIKLMYDNNKLYPVLKIEGQDIHRPYFVKNGGQCFIRIGSSTAPASRTTVLNLFNNTIAKRTEVQRLRTAAGFLKEALTYTSENIRDIQSMDYEEVIPEVDLSNVEILEVDLSYIRNASLSAEWFLVQNDLLGGHIRIDYFKGGFYSFIHDLERLNLSIRTHNNQITFGKSESKDSVLSLWEPGLAKYNESIGFLDKIVSKCDEYLSKQ